jgi:DNA primase catalytic subunit
VLSIGARSLPAVESWKTQAGSDERALGHSGRRAAEVEYRTWTDDGKLRHASFKGIREFADTAEIICPSNKQSVNIAAELTADRS